MPVYEYRCSCGSIQEVYVNEPNDLTYLPLFCKQCKQETLHLKKISLTNFKMPRGMINKDGAK
jgi:hypothetical protein